jgi:predicted TIM-barrel fold metal-dependent hydrolase
MTREELYLREFEPHSALVTEDNTPERAKFPVIDTHNHFGRWKWTGEMHSPDFAEGSWGIDDIPTALELMDRMNIRCAVNLDGGWGEQLEQNIARYQVSYPDRFRTFCWVDWSEVGEVSDFGRKWAEELERSVKAGACGLKIFKGLGLRYRNEAGELIMPDDERLIPIWEKAAELEIPVLIHTADPVAFFDPLDKHNERWEELYEHPDWHFYGEEYPSFMELIESQVRMMERQSDTTYISTHVLSYAENLGYVSDVLDRCPNVYIDFAERVMELGRQPYSAREFLIKYADRVLFGTDTFTPSPDMYRVYYRFLETDDEYFDYIRNQGRWGVYGVYLPDDVLRKIYHRNALKVIPGLDNVDLERRQS